MDKNIKLVTLKDGITRFIHNIVGEENDILNTEIMVDDTDNFECIIVDTGETAFKISIEIDEFVPEMEKR